MSVLVVLFGGARDGWKFRVPDDDVVATSGSVDLPESEGSPFNLRYRWDGTVRADGARRFRLDAQLRPG